MSDSEDDYLNDDHIQRILLEAATDLARREGVNDGGTMACGWRSSQHGVVSDGSPPSPPENLQKEQGGLPRSYSSPAIPELGRRLSDVKFPPAQSEHKQAYFYDGRSSDHDGDNDFLKRGRNSHRHARLHHVTAACEDSSDVTSPGYLVEGTVDTCDRDLSSDGSFQRIDLQQIGPEHQEGHSDTHLNQHHDVHSDTHQTQQFAVGQGYTQSGRSPQLQESDEEDSYLEESLEQSRERPIIRVLEDEDDVSVLQGEFESPVRHFYLNDSSYDSPVGRNSVLANAELEIAHLRRALHQTKEDRDELHNQYLMREKEWMHLKARFRAEIRALREQNTYLLGGRIAEDGDLNQHMVHTLLMAKKDADKALITTFEREQKINELRLLVASQQQYVLQMEESILELQRTLQAAREHKSQGLLLNNQHDTPIPYLPMRRPMDRAVLSEYGDVFQCDRSLYIPGNSTNPELSTTEVFHFAGVRRCKRKSEPFDLLKVPYVSGALYLSEED